MQIIRLRTILCSINIMIFWLLIGSWPHITYAQFNSRITHIPSESAGNEGIAVLIKIPLFERYPEEGAPVAVYLSGGFKSTGIGDKDGGLVQYGFIEIQFNFPGNDDSVAISGGLYDIRGPVSLRATCDVIRFALGILSDQDGKSLSEIVTPINPLYSNVGLIGYSNGGNTNLCIAGVHGEEIDQLAWILNWESPVGDGMPQAEAGAKSEGILRPLNPEQNSAYNPDTGFWNLEKLSYHPNIQIPLLDNTDSSVTGGLYFDFDEDNEVDPGEDFIPYPLVFETDSGCVGYYSERLRKKAENTNLIPNPAPTHIASPEETESFWYWRNGNLWIDSTIQKIPNLMFMICASDTDHVQRALDHPHVLLQYERFRQSGAYFVRLNPDQIYMEYILEHPAPTAVDIPAFTPMNHFTVRSAVEPGCYEGTLGCKTNVPAGACELADRVQDGDNNDAQLNALITGLRNLSSTPTGVQLFQNTPNPFNARTTIQFTIDHPCHVSLEIFNLLGQKVVTLIDKHHLPGKYTTQFDASALPSSIYYYRMQAGAYQLVKKMEFLK